MKNLLIKLVAFLSIPFTKTNLVGEKLSTVHFGFGNSSALYSAFGINLQLFANTNTDYLFPEFWAAGFDAINRGQYNLQRLITRDFESQLARFGDTVNVPIPPTFTAADWTPGDAISPSGVTQTTVPVILNKSKSVSFGMTGKEKTMSPYDIINEWGKPSAEAILTALNTDIYKELIAGSYVTDATSSLTESKIIDAGTALSNRKVAVGNRVIVGSPDDMGTLKKLANFSQANVTGSTDVIRDGLITSRYGFNFYENNSVDKYTPADLTGAVNAGAGYAAGIGTMVVDGFNDDANPIRKGDVFTVVGSSLQYTVQSTTLTSSDTTGITFLPVLDAAVVDDAVITFVATRSMLAFTPNCSTLAARAYAMLPDGVGVKSMIVDYEGIPIRISVFHDGRLGLTVQYDILYGVKNIDTQRIQRILTA